MSDFIKNVIGVWALRMVGIVMDSEQGVRIAKELFANDPWRVVRDGLQGWLHGDPDWVIGACTAEGSGYAAGIWLMKLTVVNGRQCALINMVKIHSSVSCIPGGAAAVFAQLNEHLDRLGVKSAVVSATLDDYRIGAQGAGWVNDHWHGKAVMVYGEN